MLCDTHCHLYHHQFDHDRAACITRAAEAAVTTLIVIGADLESSRQALTLAEGWPNVYATAGIHPHDAESFTPGALAELRALASHPKVVAVGETGLDWHRNLSPREAQYTAFCAQLELAGELDLPVVLHSREAERDVRATVAEVGNGLLRGVQHSFLGDAREAEEVLALGLYLGIGGPLTYKKNDALREAIRVLPRDRVILETDSPYLSPEPHRGKRNEPAHVRLVAERLATLWDAPVESLAATTENARRLFHRISA
jgi:TatD DNase family protein